ncbi:hypothetical protein [Thermococcus eurythermalis]|nr:hypothetical protein [Thermococcus eurythermalis]
MTAMTEWTFSDHNLIQKDVVQILRFYGFTAQEETPARIPEGGYGRTDVVGKKGHITIGVEIVDSGDVARDAKKLVMNGYTYKYIIVLRPSKHVDKILVDGEIVKVLDPTSFEHELRRDLRIPPTHPYFRGGLQQEPEIEIENIASSILQEIRDELYDIGLEMYEKDVFDALRRVYISGELQAEKRVGYNPAARMPGEYQTVNIPPEVLAILEKLQLVNTQRVGTGYSRKLVLFPNERGREAGHAIVTKTISKYQDELGRLIQNYGSQIWIVLMGSLSTRYPGQDDFYISYPINPMRKLYDGVLYKPEPYEKNPLKIMKSIYIGRSSYIRLTSPSIALFTKFVAYTTLRDFALSLFEELERFGLAIKDYLYDSRWHPIEEVYKAPRELFEFFISRTKEPPQLAYYAQKLSAYYVIARVSEIVHAQTARRTYEELLQILELPETAVAEVLADMNRLGITSRLVTRPDAAPFIVLNKKAFEKYLTDKITEIAKYV